MVDFQDGSAIEFDTEKYLRLLYPVSFYLNHPVPTKLRKVSKYQYLKQSKGEQIIEDFRVCSDDQAKDISPVLIKANCYIPPSCSMFYFEAKIIYSGLVNGTFSIGMCSQESSSNKWLGTENDSFGYRNCNVKSDCSFVSHNQFHQVFSEASPKSVHSESATDLSQIEIYQEGRISLEETCNSEPEQQIELMRLFRNRNSNLESSSRLSTLKESKLNQAIPQYSSGEIVGCGVNLIERIVFFTRNGVYLGSVGIPHKISSGTCPILYPAICLAGENVKISVNFGHEQYSFDFLKYIKSHRASLQNHAIDQKCSKILANLSAKKFILSYLLHEGHYSIAKAICPNLLLRNESDNETIKKVSQKINHSEDVFPNDKTDDGNLVSPGSDLATPLSAPIAFYDEPKWPTIKPPHKICKNSSLSKNHSSFYENTREKIEMSLPMKLSMQKPFQWPEGLTEITKRIVIRQEIMQCHFLKALSLLSLNYSDILRRVPSIAFVLQCRHFIALLENHRSIHDMNDGGQNNGDIVTSPRVNGNGDVPSSSDSFDSSSSNDLEPRVNGFFNGNEDPIDKEEKSTNTNGIGSRPKTRQNNNNNSESLLSNGGSMMNGKSLVNGKTNHQKTLEKNGTKPHAQLVNGSNSIENGRDNNEMNHFEKIITYGRELMSMAYTLYELKQIRSSHVDLLKWAFSMLAYNDVENSPFAFLLLPKHLEYLADSINSVILKNYNINGEPEIKMVIRQIEHLTCPSMNQKNSALPRDQFNSSEANADSGEIKFSYDYLNFPHVHFQGGNNDSFDDEDTYENDHADFNGEDRLLNYPFYQYFGANKEKVFSPNIFLHQNSRSANTPDSVPIKESNFEYNIDSELAGVFHPILYKSF